METSLTFKDRAKQALYFAAGAGQGLVDTVKDLAKLSILPQIQVLDSLKKTADFVRQPQEKAEKAYQQAKQDYQDLQKLWNHPKEEILKKSEKVEKVVQEKWQEFQKPFKSENPNERAKAWGELSFNVGSLFYGAGELKGLVGLGKEAAALNQAVRIEKSLVATLPKGFSSQAELKQFANIFKEGLLKTGDSEALGVLRGSSVTGVSYKTGLPFDMGRRSDLDLAIVSPKLLDRAKELGIELRGIGTRTGPLNFRNTFERTLLKEFSLKTLEKQLSNFTNRKTSFVIYKSEEELSKRGEYLLLKE